MTGKNIWELDVFKEPVFVILSKAKYTYQYQKACFFREMNTHQLSNVYLLMYHMPTVACLKDAIYTDRGQKKHYPTLTHNQTMTC